jgi:flagellar biosynthesis/type III secretory pathway M-ring protein FliF/YscJ
MPVISRSSVSRFFLPFCLVLVAFVCCAVYTHTLDTVQPEPPPEEAFTTDSVIAQHQQYEDWMQEKAERTLRAFGEDSPVAVVTATVDMNMSETEAFTPNPDLTAIESVQKTEEILCKRDSGDLMNSNPRPEPTSGKPNYKNSKQAENHLVAQTKTKTVRKTPKLARVTCVVFISEKNQERRQEIETTVAVALGLDFERGDTIIATVH